MRRWSAITVLSLASIATAGESFQDGQVYLMTSDWPGLAGALGHIDPTTGDVNVLYDFPEFPLESAITYDPYRDRIIIMPDSNSETFRLVAADGSFTELPNPWSQWDVASWAATGDGRVYQVGSVGTFGYFDAENNGHWLKDTDGVTNLDIDYGPTLKEHLIYDSITNSLFLVFLGEATQLAKIPLTEDGTQLRSPVEFYQYDAFPNKFDEPKGISAGPDGKLFVKIRAASNSPGLLMFLVDPQTLVFEPYAYVEHPSSAWNLCGTYVSTMDYAVTLDSWNNVMRTFVQSGGNQPGGILCSGVSGGSHGEFAGMISIGDTINGGPLSPPDCSDLNGDDVIDVNDLLAILAEWGTCTNCPEDLNDDGVVDVNDLLAALSDWGPC